MVFPHFPDFRFDVFLSYNTKNEVIIRELASALTAKGLRPWLDADQIPPGALFQDEIEKGMHCSAAAIAAYGGQGPGPWQTEEVRVLLQHSVSSGKRVIPVLLPGAPDRPKLPAFLSQRSWLDLTDGITPEKIDKLIWGITGKRAATSQDPAPIPHPDKAKPDPIPMPPDFYAKPPPFGNSSIPGVAANPNKKSVRHDFSEKTKRTLAKRVGMRCSNPGCQKPTSGPRYDPRKALNIGVAAHITAASPGGPRYDASLSVSVRCSIENAIWLCQNCAKLVDSDEARFTVDVLREWKSAAEDAARHYIETSESARSSSQTAERKFVCPYATVPRPGNERPILFREQFYQEDFEEALVIFPPVWDRIAEILKQQKIVAVQGLPGSGKSTFASWVYWKLSKDNRVVYLPGRHYQTLGELEIVNALTELQDQTLVLVDDAHLVQKQLDQLMCSIVAKKMRFLLLSRPGGFGNIPGIPKQPADLSQAATSIAKEMAKRYTKTEEEATRLLAESGCDLVFTKWLLASLRESPEQRNPTLESTAIEKLKEFWDAGKEALRLVLVLSAYRWLELPCSIESLTDRYGFIPETVEMLTKLREVAFDNGSRCLFLDRHPKLARLFHKAAKKFRYYSVDVLKPTCTALEIDHSALRDFAFASVVLGSAVVNGSVHASDVVDRLLFSLLHSDCAEFSRAAAQIELQVNPTVHGLDPSTIGRRLTISFAAYDAMRRETNEEQAWGLLTGLREQLGVAATPTTDFERKGYLLYQVGYHYLLTNQLDEALGYFEKAAEADDLWATRMNSKVHFGKAAMSRIIAVRAIADVLMGTSKSAADPAPDLKEIAALACKLEAERIRLEHLISGAQGMDWSWLQRWHLNALLHLAELHGCLGNESSVESLVSEAIEKAPAIGLATSTDQSAKRSHATLAFYQGHFDTVVNLLKDIEVRKDKVGEGSGRLAQLLAMSYRKLGNPVECKRWCHWLIKECPVDKANGPPVAWAKAVLKFQNR